MRMRFVDEIERAQQSLRKRSEDDSQLYDLFDEHPDLLRPTGEGPTIYSQDEIAQRAFEYFRERGFPYRNLPRHISMQEINALAKCDSLLTTNLGYHVADTYHPHRFHGHAQKKRSPYEAFQNDAILKEAIGHALNYGSAIGKEFFSALAVTNWTQGCSNFRPGVACYYYRKFCKPGYRVIDPCTGYGGRLIGFIASGMAGKYYGIDPSVETHKGNLRMAVELGFRDKVKLYNVPAEDFDVSRINPVDFSFTSPPYFAKEEYAEEETQSFKRYPDPLDWKRGFLRPFMKLQYDALKRGKYALVNIANVKFGKEIVPLEKWCVKIAEQLGFEHRDTENLVLSGHRFGSGGEEKDGEAALEPVFVFYKP